MSPDQIRRHHVVRVLHGDSKQTGVVKWAGADGSGQRHALVRFDHNGALILFPVKYLKHVAMVLPSKEPK